MMRINETSGAEHVMTTLTTIVGILGEAQGPDHVASVAVSFRFPSGLIEGIHRLVEENLGRLGAWAAGEGQRTRFNIESRPDPQNEHVALLIVTLE